PAGIPQRPGQTALPQDHAPVRAVDAGNHVQQRCFPGTIPAEHTDALVCRDGEVGLPNYLPNSDIGIVVLLDSDQMNHLSRTLSRSARSAMRPINSIANAHV